MRWPAQLGATAGLLHPWGDGPAIATATFHAWNRPPDSTSAAPAQAPPPAGPTPPHELRKVMTKEVVYRPSGDDSTEPDAATPRVALYTTGHEPSSLDGQEAACRRYLSTHQPQ